MHLIVRKLWYLDGENAHPFVGGAELQDLGDGAQISTLVGRQSFLSADVDNIKGIWRHDGRVDVAVVQQVAHNLKSQIHKNRNNCEQNVSIFL